MSTDGPGPEGTREAHPEPWRPPRPATPATPQSSEATAGPTGAGGYPSTSPWASPAGSNTGTHWSAPAAGWGTAQQWGGGQGAGQGVGQSSGHGWGAPQDRGGGQGSGQGWGTAQQWGAGPSWGPGQGWAPPGGPGIGGPGVGPAPSPARRRRGRVIAALAILLGLVVVVLGLIAATLGPRFTGTNVLDRAAVERGVAQVVTQDWKRTVGDVQCPADEPARAGNSFTCRATVDGRPQQVPVDVLDERGLYQVGQPR